MSATDVIRTATGVGGLVLAVAVGWVDRRRWRRNQQAVLLARFYVDGPDRPRLFEVRNASTSMVALDVTVRIPTRTPEGGSGWEPLGPREISNALPLGMALPVEAQLDYDRPIEVSWLSSVGSHPRRRTRLVPMRQGLGDLPMYSRAVYRLRVPLAARIAGGS